MNEIFQALILGIVQGLTELLPISSSAHLNLFPWIFGWNEISPSFDVALHIGTLFAIVLFFFKDWVNLIKGGYNQVIKKKKSTDGKIFWYIVISTIPTGILCLVLDKLSEKIMEKLATTFSIEEKMVEMFMIAIALIVMGIVLYIVDKKSKSTVDFEQMTLKQTFIIGLSQALAFIPGVSRSGVTITTARAMGVKREAAARYSFLLSTPIVFGATLLKFREFQFTDPAFIVGVLSSFVVGLIVIKFLLKYLQKGSFKGFAIYRVAFGIVILVVAVLKVKYGI